MLLSTVLITFIIQNSTFLKKEGEKEEKTRVLNEDIVWKNKRENYAL